MLITKTLVLFGSDESRLSEARLAIEEEYGKDPLLIHAYLRQNEMLAHIEQQMTYVVFIDALDKSAESMPEVILKIRLRSPNTLVLVQSEEPSVHEVASAMKAGAFDYLDREAPRKEMARAARRALKFSSFEVDRNQLSERWIFSTFERLENAYSDGFGSGDLSRGKKGKLLEELSLALFSSVEGWNYIEPNSRPSKAEEIDLVIFNESADPFWLRRGDIILVECKNIASGASAGDFAKFFFKIEKRRPNCRLGFLIARSIRGTYQELMKEIQGRESVVVPLDYAHALVPLVHAVDRSTALRRLVTLTTLGKPTWMNRAPKPSILDEEDKS